MPRRLYLPDSSYVTVPDNATDEQGLAWAKQNFPDAFPAAVKAPVVPLERTYGEAVTDVGASAVSGLGSLIQLPSQLTGLVSGDMTPGMLGRAGKSVEDYGQSLKSKYLIQQQQEQQKRQEEAYAKSGFFGEAGEALKGTITNPALLTSFLAEQIPNLIGSMGVGFVAKYGTKTVLAIAGKTAEEIAPLAAKYGVRTAVAANALMQGTDVGADTYQQVYDRLGEVAPYMSEAERQETALSKARVAAFEAGVISMGLGAVPGTQTIERALLGKGLKKTEKELSEGVFKRTAKGVLGEAAQEGIEEGPGGQLLTNIGLQQVDPNQELGKGVGAATALGSIAGGVFGGAAGAASRPQRTQERPTLDNALNMLVDRAVGAGVDPRQAFSGAVQAVAAEAKEGDKITVFDSVGNDREATISGRDADGIPLITIDNLDDDNRNYVLGQEWSPYSPGQVIDVEGQLVHVAPLSDGSYAQDLPDDALTQRHDDLADQVLANQSQFAQDNTDRPEYHIAERDLATVVAQQQIRQATPVQTEKSPLQVLREMNKQKREEAKTEAPAEVVSEADTAPVESVKPEEVAQPTPPVNVAPTEVVTAPETPAAVPFNKFITTKTAPAAAEAAAVTPAAVPFNKFIATDTAAAVTPAPAPPPAPPAPPAPKATQKKAEKPQVEVDRLEDLKRRALNLKITPTTTLTELSEMLQGTDQKVEATQPQVEVDPLEAVREKMSDLGIDPETTKAQVMNFAKKLAKQGLIEESDVNMLATISKDRDMGPEDILSELDGSLRAINPKYAKAKKKAAPTGSEIVSGIKTKRREAAFKQALPRVAKLVEQRLGALGLNKYIKPQLMQSIATPEGDEAAGAYMKKVVMLAVSGKSDAQIMATLNHESIHAMREIGMITDQEWSNLKKIADRNNWIELFNIAGRGYEGEDLQYEEAIAEAFATYTTGRSTPIGYANDRPQYVYKKDLNLAGQPVGIIKRILKMLRVIRETSEELGADEVFKRIEETPIAATKAAEEAAETKFSKAQKQFLSGSVVKDRVYHGTNADITQFDGYVYAGWFSKEPSQASDYTLPVGTRETGPNVMPVYLSMKNPLRVDVDMNDNAEAIKPLLRKMGLSDDLSDEGYGGGKLVYRVVNSPKFAERVYELGHDGVIAKENGVETYAPSQATQIKSAIGNQGTFDQNESDIRFSKAVRNGNIVKSGEKYVYEGDLPESFTKYFGKSTIQQDGNPLVAFHGTAQDIMAFRAKQANAIFVAFDPSLAEGFAYSSQDWMNKNWRKILTPEQQEKAVADAKRNIKQDMDIPAKSRKMLIDSLEGDNPTGEALDRISQAAAEYMPSAGNILPLFVKAEKPFDYENKADVDAVWNRMIELNRAFTSSAYVKENISNGSWSDIESQLAQAAIRELGFDSFYVQEGQRKNLAVYDATQLKSAIGNNGAFDPENADIRFSKAKRFATDNSAAYATKKEVSQVRGILPLHPDAEEHMREKLMWDEKDTGDYKNPRMVFTEGKKKFVVGPLTVDDWLDRVKSTLSQLEIIKSREWYREVKLDFQENFGDEWPKYMVAYLLGNKAESPRGALNNTLYVAEEIKTMTASDRKGGLSDEQIRQIFSGQPVSLVGIGSKLYDFVDSALGKTTRAWMGDAIEGNSPFVVDRHTFRDSGRVDDAILSYIQKNFGDAAANRVKLDTPTTGMVSAPQYEKITEWGNKLADELNEMNYLGGNWTPLEVQAVGWMTMTRITETTAGGTTEGAVAGMTKTVPVELDFGAGAPYNVKFKEWHDLPSDAKARVTYKVMREVASTVAELSGTKVKDFTEGVGGWGQYVNPNAIIRFLASDNTAEALTSMAAYLAHQTKVYAFHPANAQTGDSVAFDISPVGKTPFTNDDITNRIWPELFKQLDPVMGRDENGDPRIGFVQAKTSDGRPTIRMVVPLPTGFFTAGPNKGKPKSISDLSVADRKAAEEKLTSSLAPAIKDALKNIAGDYALDYGRIKVVSSSNNWEENKNGQSHRQGVVARFGQSVQRRLDDVGVPRIEAAIRKAIGEEGVTFDEPRRFGTVNPAGLPQYDQGGDRRADSSVLVAGETLPAVDLGNGFYQLKKSPESAAAFRKAISAAAKANKSGAAVTVYDNYDDVDHLVVADDGLAGVGVRGNDIISVFKHPDSKLKNVGSTLVGHAVNLGGRRLDAFDTVLPKIYSSAGFKAVARTGFNDKYKPEGWNYDTFSQYNGGRPDVVFMVYDPRYGKPYAVGDGVEISDYDDGAVIQEQALKDIQDDPNGDPEPKLSYAPRKVTAVFGGRGIPAQWSSPASNRMLDFVYNLQDKFIDLKQIIGEVNKINGQISDDMNAYMKEELFHGKVAKQTLDFNKRELAPLLKEMQSLGVDEDELQKYLWNRHAEERNDKVASINSNFSDMGSGIATADAKAYLASIPAAKKAKLDRIAARVDKIVKETKDLMEQQGLITPEIRKQWDASYKYYVPLQREEKDYEGAGMGMGQGFSVTPSVKRAMGSILPVENILANVIASRERTIVRAEKNIVAKALFSLAVKSPNPNFWIAVTPSALKAGSKVIGELQRFGFSLNEIQNIAAEPTVRYVADSGFVEDRINPALRNRDNVLHLMIDGREHLVIFNQTDPTANRLSKALKNIDAGTMGIAMSSAAAVTRWFAAINTQYNPIFGIINLLRDQSTAMFNLSTTPIAGMQKQVYGNSFAAMKGIWEQLRAEQRGQSATSQWGKLFEEFEKEGGPTGYRDMFASSKDRADAIASEFEQLKEGKLKKGGRAIFEMLSNYNTALENGVRLSAYKAALDKGLSKQKAASIAKNLTVNFNRKGDVTMQMNALYAFFNASVQGSARLIETLRGPAGRRIIYGGLTLGMLQSVALIAAGFDDEEPPEFIKERNIIIPTGGGKYITIPMPLGFNVIPNAGRVITDLVLRKNVNVPKKLSSLMLTTIGAFNPVGGGTLSQVLAPTVVDPIIALAENKDNFGRPIYKTDVSGLRPTPGYLRTKETATPWNKAITKFLNYATGGTEFKQGAFSPTPDQFDYLVGVVFGGLGREISKGAQSVGAAISGEELPTYKIPLVSRFYGNTNEAASVASKFYENIKNLNEHAAEIKGRRESRQDVGEYVKDNPEARLSPMATGIYNIINNLNKQKKMALERGLPRERIKQIETQMQMQMKRLNDRVREVRQ